MSRFLRSCVLLLLAGALLPLALPAQAADPPTYVIVYIPVNWSASRDAFEDEARRQGEFFVAESGIGSYANVEFIFLRERLDGVSLADPWLAATIVAFGLPRQPADRYIGLTDGDLAPGGASSVVGWTLGPDSLGMVVEAEDLAVSAHELGHTYALCDEYSWAAWSDQNSEWGCPNPYPPQCAPAANIPCRGMPAPDGSNSIMGPAGLAGEYSYNEPSLAHLQTVFAGLFGPSAPAPEPTPLPPTPEPAPVIGPVALAGPALVRLDPDGARRQLAPGPVLHPAWSPDGRWIAYASAVEGGLDLYRMPASGGLPDRLTDNPARETHPAWLADSARIFFSSDADGAPALFLLDVEAGTTRPLPGLPSPASWPAVSPDGRTLVFSAAPDGDWELYWVLLEAGGQPTLGSLERLTRSPGPDVNPAWNADGSLLAFASARSGSLDLYLWSPDNAPATRLTDSPANEWAPRWLPDGRVIFHVYDGWRLGLWVLDPGTGAASPFAPELASAAWPAPQP